MALLRRNNGETVIYVGPAALGAPAPATDPGSPVVYQKFGGFPQIPVRILADAARIAGTARL
jgi:hypothetical protein